MNEFNARRAATQFERARFNASMKTFVAFEAVATSVAIGIHHDSLAIGMVAFVCLMVGFVMPEYQRKLAWLFSAAWGVAAFMVLHLFDPSEPIAWFVAAGIAFFASLGAHGCFIQWDRDFQ